MREYKYGSTVISARDTGSLQSGSAGGNLVGGETRGALVGDEAGGVLLTMMRS